MNLVGKTIKSYEIREKTDSGHSGDVYRALDHLSGEVVIFKAYHRKCVKDFENEVEVYSRIPESQYTVRMLDYDPSHSYYDEHGKSQTIRYIVLEYMPRGDLFALISSPQQIPNVKEIFLSIINGIEHIHRAGYVHRDIKAENIFISNDFSMKIGDFGFSTANCSTSGPAEGTIEYLAPEGMSSSSFDPIKTDIFALGVLLFVLVARNYPFTSASILNSYYRPIYNQNYEFFWRKHQALLRIEFEDSFKKLIERMLAYNPEHRPSLQEIKDSDWLRII